MTSFDKRFYAVALAALLGVAVVAYFVGRARERAEAEDAHRALQEEAALQRDSLNAAVARIAGAALAWQGAAAEAEGRAADALAYADRLGAENAALRERRNEVAVVYRDRVAAYDATGEGCDLALESCRAYGRVLELEVAGLTDEVGAVREALAHERTAAEGYRSAYVLADSALAASEAGRRRLLDRIAAVAPPRRPQVYVGPAVSLGSGAWGAQALVSVRPRLPVVGRLELMGSATVTPSEVVLGLTVGL